MHRRRRLFPEALESRRVLAAAVLHNPVDPIDVNLDGQRTLQDGLAIVHFLHRVGPADVSQLGEGEGVSFALDVNGDNFITHRDMLEVVEAFQGAGQASPTDMALEAMSEGEHFSDGLTQEELDALTADAELVNSVLENGNAELNAIRSDFWGAAYPTAISWFTDAFANNAHDLADAAGSPGARSIDLQDSEDLNELFAEAQHAAADWNAELNSIQTSFNTLSGEFAQSLLAGHDRDAVIAMYESDVQEISESLSELVSARDAWLDDIESNLATINDSRGVDDFDPSLGDYNFMLNMTLFQENVVADGVVPISQDGNRFWADSITPNNVAVTDADGNDIGFNYTIDSFSVNATYIPYVGAIGDAWISLSQNGQQMDLDLKWYAIAPFGGVDMDSGEADGAIFYQGRQVGEFQVALQF